MKSLRWNLIQGTVWKVCQIPSSLLRSTVSNCHVKFSFENKTESLAIVLLLPQIRGDIKFYIS